MFTDASSNALGFSSSWKSELSMKNENVQTDSTSYDDKEVQASTSRNIVIQTEELKKSNNADNVDYDKLAAFLKFVFPSVVKELDKNQHSRAFDVHEFTSNDDIEEKEAKLLYSLVQPSLAVSHQMKVSTLSWNCSGTVLAVGLGVTYHDSWCNHAGIVSIYYVGRKDFSLSSDKDLETSSCVTALAFHTITPSILAVGTYNGKIKVWREYGDIVTTSSEHTGSITSLGWITDHKHMVLVSSSLDGYILLWHVGSSSESLHINSRFHISMDSNISKLYSPIGSSILQRTLGITCFSFFKLDLTTFIVGVEGGDVLHCSTLTSKVAAGIKVLTDSDLTIMDPIVGPMKRHDGCVISVECYPDKKDMFVSCGSDSKIHVYKLEQVTPIRVIHTSETIAGLTWWMFEKSVFAIWGSVLELYSIPKKNCSPILHFDIGEPITALNLNIHSSTLVAIGTVCGKISILRFPRKLVNEC